MVAARVKADYGFGVKEPMELFWCEMVWRLLTYANESSVDVLGHAFGWCVLDCFDWNGARFVLNECRVLKG